MNSSNLYDHICIRELAHVLCISALVVLSTVWLLACSENSVAPAENPATLLKANKLNGEIYPVTILNGEAFHSPVAHVLSKAHSSEAQGFATPLFGLGTAPNGDILVADAGYGVVTQSGYQQISLPGATDISPIGRSAMWATKGLTGSPGDNTGQALYRISNGQTRMIADLFAFEENNNPDGAELIDSNPFDVQSLGGNAALVADAAGNDLLHIDNRGNVRVVAVLPNEMVSTDNIKTLEGCAEGDTEGICGLPPMLPAQPVATSIAIGPDGNYYVGELKGFPAPTGASNIWRIAPGASWAQCGSSPDCVKVFDGGFTSIIDLAFGPDGDLYVVELEEKSWYALEVEGLTLAGGTINKCDLATSSCTEVASGIPMVTAIAFDHDGNLWATKNALVPPLAEVFKVE